MMSSKNQVVEAHDHTTNKNIRDLKNLRKDETKFSEIYGILNRIASENDFIAMNFAVKEDFCNIKNEKGKIIFHTAVKECNIRLARLIIEFGGNSNDNQTISNGFYLRFILKTQHFECNVSLIYASRYGYHEVVKHLLTVPGIDVNAKNNRNKTALIWVSQFLA